MENAAFHDAPGSALLTRPWTPFRRCQPDRRDPESEVYLNSRYQVHLRRLKAQGGGPDLIHLSFKRQDRRVLIPYADKLRIKDELVAPECEGVELLPARSREVDTANQYHCWVIDSVHVRFPFHPTMPVACLEAPASVNTVDVLKTPWTPLLLVKAEPPALIYRNSRYQIDLQQDAGQEEGLSGTQLWCQRLDSSPLIPYRDRMRIKDELLGPECEGIELLPARSREVATRAGCLLWVSHGPSFRFPFGFAERCVSDVALDGAVQDPWPPGERPADCLSEKELRAFLRRRPHPSS